MSSRSPSLQGHALYTVHEAQNCAMNIRRFLAAGVSSIRGFHCHVKESNFIRNKTGPGITTEPPMTELALAFTSGTIEIPIQVGCRQGSVGIFLKSLNDGSTCYCTARHTVLEDDALEGRPNVVLWSDPSSYQSKIQETLPIAEKYAKRPGPSGAQYTEIVNELALCQKKVHGPFGLGHGNVREAPPIALDRHTRDVAVIEFPSASARSSIEAQTIWLGSRDLLELGRLMGPNFEVSTDNSLTLTGVVAWRVVVGQKVIKRGRTTHVTTGTVNGAQTLFNVGSNSRPATWPRPLSLMITTPRVAQPFPSNLTSGCRSLLTIQCTTSLQTR